MRRKTKKNTTSVDTPAPPSRHTGLRQMASASVLIIALFAIYAVGVTGRMQEMEQHSLRILAQMGTSIEDVIVNSHNVVDNLKKSAFACEFFDRQSRLTLDGQPDCKKLGEYIDRVEKEYRNSFEECGYLDEQAVEPKLKVYRSVQSSRSGFEINANFEIELRLDQKGNSSQTEECEDKSESMSVNLHLDLDEVLDATSFGSAFQAILIADEKSLVVSQHTPSGHALFEPPGLHQQHDSAGFAVGNLNQLISVDKDKDKDEEPATAVSRHTTSVDSVRLAGTRYTLMCQPLVLELGAVARDDQTDDTGNGTADASNTYRICGLINGGRSLRQSLEVASPLAIGMFAFVLMGILAWPIVKLTTLRPRERMRFVEVYVSMLATIAVLMVSTVLLLCTDRAFLGNDGSRDRLAHLGERLEKNLKDEFAQAHDQLLAFDADLPQVVERWETLCASYSGDTDANLCIANEGPNWLKTGILDGGSDAVNFPKPDEYPYLAQVFWMRLDSGMQLLKAAAGQANTPAVSVKSRDYYQKVAEEELWAVRRHKKVAEEEQETVPKKEYFVQSFRSLTTGEFSAAISTRSKHYCRDERRYTSCDDECAKECGNECNGASVKACVDACEVMRADEKASLCQLREKNQGNEAETEDFDLGIVLALKPLSLVDPILAPGVSFAIVDNKTGKAIFHSDVRHATVENLFDDEGIADRVRAAIQSGVTVDFDGRYRTRPHRVHVRHVPEIPWTIVMFEDAEITRTSSVEVLSRAVFMVALHLSVLGLLTGIYLAINGRETPAWIWPTAHWAHADRIKLYRGGCWWLVACGLAMMTVICLVNGPAISWAIAVPQLVIVVLLFAGSAHTVDEKYVKWFEFSGQWGLVATLIVCAALSGFSQTALGDPPLAAAAFLLALGLTLVWTRWKGLRISGVTRWIFVITALVAICAIRIFDSLFWALWCLAAFFAVYLLLPLDSWNHRLRGYQLLSMLVWLVIAIPPAVGYFKIAHERELLIFEALEKDYSKRASDHRLHELDELMGERPGIEKFCASPKAAHTNESVNPPTQRESEDCIVVNLLEQGRKAYAVDGIGRLGHLPFASESVEEPAQGACVQASGTDDNLCASISKTIDRHFPIYNEMTRYGRYESLQSGTSRFSLPFGSAVLFGSIVMLGLLWAWVAYGARRLFYGEIGARNQPVTVSRIVNHDFDRHTIATLATRAQYAFVSRQSSAHNVFNLSEDASLRELEKLGCHGPVLCTHLGDALRDDKLRLRVLSLLETLSKCPSGDVLVLTGVPIVQTSSSVSSTAEPSNVDGRTVAFPFENDGESARWRDILAHFESVDVSVLGDIKPPLASKASLAHLPDKKWLEIELNAIADLSSLMGPDYERTLTKPLTRREVIKEIGKRADWFYRSLWDNCTTDEKLVLTQLSREGVVNPRQVNAVRSLLARGLLRMDPVLKPVNNSFGRFVASMFDAAECAQLETAGRTRGFNKRRILMGLILVVMLFLWFTQRDVVETWIAYVGAIAVGMTGVLKIMDSLKGGAAQR